MRLGDALSAADGGFVDKTERMSRADLAAGARRKAPAGQTEEQFHRAVVELLDSVLPAGCFWFHPPNGEKRPHGSGGKMKGLGARAGMPDICIVWRGRLHCIELKAPGGKLSASQRTTHALIVGCGVEVLVAYEIEQVMACLRHWGMIR